MTIDVVIPARNEEKTIGEVLEVLSSHLFIGTIIVVCDSCTDNTDMVASEHYGDIVMAGEYGGKGQAVMAGLDHVTTERVLFMDADITGLYHEHITKMVAPFPGMTIGVADLDPELPNRNDWAWPWVSGQRILPTNLVRPLELHGYLMETQINMAAKDARIPIEFAWLMGLKSDYNMSERRLAEMERDLKWGKEHGVL